MLQPTDGRPSYPFRATSRPGVVTCARCGCRLTPDPDRTDVWYHFSPLGGRDARGCRVACAEDAHDATGLVAAASLA
jgi:hypothetical protein